MNTSRAILSISAIVVTVVSIFAFKSHKNARNQLYTDTTNRCRLVDCYTVPPGGTVENPCTSGITYYIKLTAVNHIRCTTVASGLKTATD